MWKEFRPTILFLVKFFAIYFVLSGVYGFYIARYDTASPSVNDPITRAVAYNCTRTASWLGYQPSIVEDDHLNREVLPEQTYDSIWLNGVYALSVEEGCNGINIMILFLAFVVAFGGKLVNMLLFIPAGFVFIHIANLGRLLLLTYINVELEGRGYHFFHKYVFTAIIYVAVLLLWYLWVARFSGSPLFKKKKTTTDEN